MDSIIITNDTSAEDKYKIYNMLDLCKRHFNNSRYGNNEKNMLETLNTLNLDFSLCIKKINIKNVFEFLNNGNNCKRCNKEIKQLNVWPKRSNIKIFCGVKCAAAYRNENNLCWNQNGINRNNNLIVSATKKQSNTMKNKIKNGTFKPQATNSWAGSKCSLILNDSKIVYRSSWEAFFHLCNKHLLYEHTIIQYIHENISRNYILDFTDIKNKVIYEIKPSAILKNNGKGNINKSKFKYAKKWAKDNNYTLKFITDDWFFDNFIKNIKLLDGQADKELIYKRLKQFEIDEN